MRRPPWGQQTQTEDSKVVGRLPRTKRIPHLYFVCPAVFGEVLDYISVFKNQKVSLKTLNFQHLLKTQKMGHFVKWSLAPCRHTHALQFAAVPTQHFSLPEL